MLYFAERVRKHKFTSIWGVVRYLNARICSNRIDGRLGDSHCAEYSASKAMPYESGMVPIGEGTRRMPVRFYLIAVLFILFDIEVVFFLPWAIVFRQLGLFGLIEMIIFIVILLVGYIYAWKKGALEWE
jgi:NADH-quinone oxidoreductase subunit A